MSANTFQTKIIEITIGVTIVLLVSVAAALYYPKLVHKTSHIRLENLEAQRDEINEEIQSIRQYIKEHE